MELHTIEINYALKVSVHLADFSYIFQTEWMIPENQFISVDYTYKPSLYGFHRCLYPTLSIWKEIAIASNSLGLLSKKKKNPLKETGLYFSTNFWNSSIL